MPVWFRRALLLLILGGLAALAHGPVLVAEASVGDHGILARAGLADSTAPAPLLELSTADLFRVDTVGDEPGWPLSGLSLAISRRLFGIGGLEGGKGPWPYRLQNLVLLALAAIGLHRFLRRLLQPWIGNEQTTEASRTAAALFLLHPLAPAIVFSLSARSDLLSVLFLVWAAAAFLRGRQDRKGVLTVIAFGLALLAGLSGELGLLLPVVLGFSEYISAHRYRKRRERLRTTVTTVLVYGGAVALTAFLRVAETGALPAPGLVATVRALDDPEAAAGVALLAVEKLGVLILPSNVHSTGVFGTALGGLLFLFALQPALVAARTAPRLWGWLLFGWLAALVVAGFRGAELRVNPGHLGPAGVLFAASAVMCVGLGVAATAVSGVVRQVRPAVLAVGFAVLAHGNARPLAESARYAGEVKRDLVEARQRHGRDAAILMIDSREPVRGVDPLGPEVAALLHPAELELTVLTEPAFLALTREREFDELRADSLLVVFPTNERRVRGVGPTRRSVLLGPAQPTRGIKGWRRESRSPDLDVEALSIDALRATAPVGTATRDGVLRVEWRATAPIALPLSCEGTWWSDEPVPVVEFDLSSSLAWRLSDRVRRAWFESGPATLGQVELLEELMPLGPAFRPEPDGGDWYFGMELEEPLASRVLASRDRAAWRVGLLDLYSFEYVQIDGTVLPSGTVLVQDAAARVRSFVRDTGGPVAWHLDLLVDGVAVARAHGRRIGRLGSREE